ncbi:hypothetical protein DL96DRAFT_1589832 [Flagelloscypha sp. PMI_526]|nr:hypothetical protein DL96DRAFT_1589832 [Flagelloscypha sp. PMI_526]
MATSVLAPTSIGLSSPRKRTNSFSFPSPSMDRPAKAPRLSLKRTASFLDLGSAFDEVPSSTTARRASSSKKKSRTTTPKKPLQISSPPIPSCSYPSSPPSTLHPPLPTSPLAPNHRTATPNRPSFPKSKPKVDLHRKAVTTCMLRTPEGQRFLHVGPRLSFSIANATKELERIVAAAMEVESMDGDYTSSNSSCTDNNMAVDPLATSWVVIPPPEPSPSSTLLQSCDWEMVSCA